MFNDYVLRFNISVNDSIAVKIRDSFEDIAENK